MVERLGVVHCQYGEALFGEGRYSQALMIYEQAAQYRPEDKEVVMKRSVGTVAGGVMLQYIIEDLMVINHV